MGKPKKKREEDGSILPLAGKQEDAGQQHWQTLDQVRRRKITWLWSGRIPETMLTILEGRKGVGKSTMLGAIVAAATGVTALPGMRKTRTPSAAIWLAGEEDGGMILRPRLEAACVPLRLVYTPVPDETTGTVRRIYLPGDLHRLDDLVRRSGARIFVADPWGSFVAPGIDLHQEAQARSVLEPLAEWCATRGVTGILTRHLRKSRQGPALDQGLGGTAVGNVCRSILRCDRHPDIPGIFTLCKVGGNISSDQPTLTYRLVQRGESVVVDWDGQTTLDADTLAQADADRGGRDEVNDARRILRSLIGDEWRTYQEILAEARQAGVGERRLREAKMELGVQSRRISQGRGGHWEWGPPPGGWPE